MAVHQIHRAISPDWESSQRQPHWGQSSAWSPLPSPYHFNLSTEQNACVSLYLACLNHRLKLLCSPPGPAAWISENLHFTKNAIFFSLTYSWKLEEIQGEFRGSKKKPILFDQISVKCHTPGPDYSSARCPHCGKPSVSQDSFITLNPDFTKNSFFIFNSC